MLAEINGRLNFILLADRVKTIHQSSLRRNRKSAFNYRQGGDSSLFINRLKGSLRLVGLDPSRETKSHVREGSFTLFFGEIQKRL